MMKTVTFPKVLPQRPVLISQSTHWSSLSLEHHFQPPGETTEYSLEHFTISVLLNQELKAEGYI